MALNASYWDSHFRNAVLPEVRMYAQVIEKRLLPVFDRAEQEADAVANADFDESMSAPADETSNFDPADAADQAFEKGLLHYQLLEGVRQSLLNIAAVHLHHQFEQHLLLFHKQELLNMGEENNHKLLDRKEVWSRLMAHGVDVTTFASWEKIDELRLVANVVKHAEGSASRQLTSRRPDLFTSPQLRNDPFWGSFVPSGVDRPLSGNDFFVTLSDFQSYTESVLRFWQELGQALIALPD